MPQKVKVIEKVLKTLGFEQTRKKCSHSRWKHPDGRATTVSSHGSNELGTGLFKRILKDIDITEEEFNKLI
ncbi:type II toxin-antitoxin system HicA family toxin [Anabaena sp. UHCC 0451]|uniref:type II toxin-antitoxin system HicA family toxin n=1 Tax=Anabaena sp. UHCC 0451 TaxID=2055235 RepID=UPI002B1EF6E1|nr:type II toxin-antitoxin system HicA family toxin [Anabaena sp. UHCC 0451]MEA5576017.1 type II toxin-antitoxin system HicA family toxin [Anabaena sp. UHCC 0451]